MKKILLALFVFGSISTFASTKCEQAIDLVSTAAESVGMLKISVHELNINDESKEAIVSDTAKNLVDATKKAKEICSSP
ncbi:MAG: hypothetical protein ACOYL6_09045 [Bacteriovoracaceae bacterium]